MIPSILTVLAVTLAALLHVKLNSDSRGYLTERDMIGIVAGYDAAIIASLFIWLLWSLWFK